MATKTMKLEVIEEMTDNYKSNQLVSITTNPEIPMEFDAESVWFDLNKLKEFITAIETETAKHPEYGMKGFGVRFYYSAYSSNCQDPAYAKLHTLVAIPTACIDEVNTDFDPYNTSTYDGTKPSGVGTVIMAENHGGLTPPNSQAGSWF